jgi:hypothetical protein
MYRQPHNVRQTIRQISTTTGSATYRRYSSHSCYEACSHSTTPPTLTAMGQSFIMTLYYIRKFVFFSYTLLFNLIRVLIYDIKSVSILNFHQLRWKYNRQDCLVKNWVRLYLLGYLSISVFTTQNFKIKEKNEKPFLKCSK